MSKDMVAQMESRADQADIPVDSVPAAEPTGDQPPENLTQDPKTKEAKHNGQSATWHRVPHPKLAATAFSSSSGIRSPTFRVYILQLHGLGMGVRFGHVHESAAGAHGQRRVG